jgi:hypothetical protein
MTDQLNRIYAVNLMNRANVAFDARDVGVVASIIAVLEADVADWLSAQPADTITDEAPIRGVREGNYRPELPQPHPAAASLESNLK